MSKLIKRSARGVLAKIASNVSDESMHRTQNRMAIAIKIAECLKNLGMSQKDFATKMCKTESEISDWLSGSRNFTIDTLSDVESVLHIRLLDSSIMNLKELDSCIEQRISKGSGFDFSFHSSIFTMNEKDMCKIENVG